MTIAMSKQAEAAVGPRSAIDLGAHAEPPLSEGLTHLIEDLLRLLTTRDRQPVSEGGPTWIRGGVARRRSPSRTST